MYHKYFLNVYMGGVKTERMKICVLRVGEYRHLSHPFAKEDSHCK